MNKEAIIAECLNMKIGQWLELAPESLYDNFRFGYPTIYETIDDAVISSLPGSMWGCYRLHRTERNTFIISKHKEEDKVYYTDPDRRI